MVVDLVQGTDRGRFETSVLCLARRGQLADELPPNQVYLAPAMKAGSMLIPLALTRTLGHLAPDLVHIHSGVWFKSARAAHRAGIAPVIFTDHGRTHPDPLAARWLDHAASRLTRRVVAVSEPLREYLERKVWVDPCKLSVIRNGVRPPAVADDSAPLSVREELGVPAGAVVVGSVGRLDTVKAYDVLIRAMGKVRANRDGGPPAVLVLVGDGPDRARLEQVIRDANLTDAVILTGWRSDASRLLGSFDLFVLSSDSEGTSVSLLEAMAAGVPPVATAVGGNPAVLGPLMKDQLVPPQDPAALASVIESSLRDLGRAARLRQLGPARVAAEFGLARMIGEYELLYSQLLGSSS